MTTDGTSAPTMIAADRNDVYASTGDRPTLLAPNASPALQANGVAFADQTALSGGVGVAAFTLLFNEATNGRVHDRSLDRTIPETLEPVAPETAASTSAFLDKPISNPVADHSPTATQSQIVIVPRTAQTLYVSWDASQAEKDALKQQGGQHLVLRVYAVTGDTLCTHNVQQCFCNDWDHDQSVPIAVSNLDYVAELGYVTLDGRFLLLARSPQTRVPGA